MSNIIVIGASQGGVQALQTLLKGLGSDFPTPILIVLHIGASESQLPSILSGIDSLNVSFGRHQQPVFPGHIYIAPPDHHLLISDGFMELSHGPRENWARPAIDPLFRSAALTHGPEVIGIILTGQLNDGTAGLFEIKQRGGIAIVQTPSGAEAPSMPRNALENVAVDYCLPIEDMPRLLRQLTSEEAAGRISTLLGPLPMDPKDAIIEPSAQTCPECGGAMRQENNGTITQFRCHIGHIMTAEILAATQLETLENELSGVRRLLNERLALCRDMAEKHIAAGNMPAAESWKQAAREASNRADVIEQLVDQEWIHPEED